MPHGTSKKILARIVDVQKALKELPFSKKWTLGALAEALGLTMPQLQYIFYSGFLDGQYVGMGRIYVLAEFVPVLERGLLTLVAKLTKSCKTRLCSVTTRVYLRELCLGRGGLANNPSYLSVVNYILSKHAVVKKDKRKKSYIFIREEVVGYNDERALRKVRRVLCSNE